MIRNTGRRTSAKKIAFQTGYDAAGTNDKGELTGSTENSKLFKLPINENGRYWAEITMDLNGTQFRMVRLVEVKNIYREYSIQVKSEELDKNGDPRATRTMRRSRRRSVRTMPEATASHGI